MNDERNELLNILDFGNVDAKQDEFLKDWFISTEEFRDFFDRRYYLILGGKGSGKSAIFNLIIKHRDTAESLYGEKQDNVFILPAFGIGSDDEINFEQLRDISPENQNDFLYLWKLYIALRIGKFIVSERVFRSTGWKVYIRNLLGQQEKNENFKKIQKYMRRVGIISNGRPLKSLNEWFRDFLGVRICVKTKGFDVSFIDDEIINITQIDVNNLLTIENGLLRDYGKEIWILMDELDTNYSTDLEKRKIYLQALMQFLLIFVGRFSNIKLKIFLRTDIYNTLQIVNKSHLESGKLTLKWNAENLVILLTTRALHYAKMKDFLKSRGTDLPEDTRKISFDRAKEIFYCIFDQQVKKGTREAKYSHEWILNRITDGKGEMFPREFIHYGNISVAEQKRLNKIQGRFNTDKLISGKAIENSLNDISTFRVDTYLNAEFPHLVPHFNKLRGSTKKRFSRDELLSKFKDLEPKGKEAIEQIHEAGLLKIRDGKKPIDAAQKFEIPPLYIIGLGITVRGRK